MTTQEIKDQGQTWLDIQAKIEALENERDNAETAILRAASQIGKEMRTEHGRSLFSRTSEYAKLREFDGDTFSFDIYDGYEREYTGSFKLTAKQLADPDREVARLKEERRRKTLAAAEQEAKRAQEKLDRLRTTPSA